MYENYESANFHSSSNTNQHMKKVYSWMFLALLVTSLTSIVVSGTSLSHIINGPLMFILCIAELILVFIIAGRVNKISPESAFVLFMVYSILNGLTLSSLLHHYTAASLVNTFLVAAGMFGAMSIYGYTTKKDISGLGTFFFMALIGLILALIVNIFLHSSALDLIISFIGVVIFSGLTAYDTQMIKNEPTYRKYPILAALDLYLDFINLFLYLLRFFGISKD